MNDPAAWIADILKEQNSILISVHKDPDGDALGSQLALMLALKKSGKKVIAHNLDPAPGQYRFLPHCDELATGKAVSGAYDALVVLDSEPERTGLFNDAYPAQTLVNIDHHGTNQCKWPLKWLDPAAAATGELVYGLVKALNVQIDREIALCLFTAIFTDTGSFRYSNTTPESMRVSASLLEFGIDPWIVSESVYESFAFDRLRLLGGVLKGMKRSKDGRIAWVVITDELYRETGTSSKDTENFINFVRSVKGVEVAILFRQTGERQYKVSLRSKGRADVAAVAQTLGGGGHKNAAGCIIDGTFEEIKGKVLNRTEKALENQKSAK